jgi:hypothetical protein
MTQAKIICAESQEKFVNFVLLKIFPNLALRDYRGLIKAQKAPNFLMLGTGVEDSDPVPDLY